MKRKWTRGEKRLWLAPLLLVIFGIGATWGPRLVLQKLGLPVERLEATGSDSIHCLVRSQDGTVVAASSYVEANKSKYQQGKLYFGDAKTLKLKSQWDLPERNRLPRIAYVSAFALSPEGKRVGFAYHTGPFGVSDVATHRSLWQHPGRYLITVAQFSPDGKTIGVAHEVGAHLQYDFFDAQTGRQKIRWTVQTLFGDQAFFIFAPDGKMVASVGTRIPAPNAAQNDLDNEGRYLELRQFPSGKLIRTLPTLRTYHADFSPQGDRVLATAHKSTPSQSNFTGNRLFLYSVASGQQVWSYPPNSAPKSDAVASISSAIFSPDGKRIAVYSFAASLAASPEILLLDAQSGQVVRRLKFEGNSTHFSNPQTLAFSLDGTRLFARGEKEILVWDLD